MNELTNFTGKRLGKLKVLERVEDHTQSNGRKRVQWRCICDCGNEKIIKTDRLKAGMDHCGCLDKAKHTIKIGNKYGRLTVLSDSGKRNNREIVWECRCDCGNTHYVPGTSLRRGSTKSCGCLKKELEDNSPSLDDLIGQRFERWLVIHRASNLKGNRSARWHCKCDCGNEKDVFANSLKSGRSTSCGCYDIECKYARTGEKHPMWGRFGKNHPRFKHGLTGTNTLSGILATKRKKRILDQTPKLTIYEKNKKAFYHKIVEYMGTNNWHVDHIQPVSKGGADHPDNLWIIPAIDNIKKANKIDYKLPHNLYFKL